ncbi:MAG: hypothetical protein ACJ76H_14885 [Bacteriovoracaceae bacterium]
MKALILLLGIVPALAFANDCAKDAQRLCGGIDPGKNQIYKCLSDYEDQLTSACKQEMSKFRQKTLAKNPCFADLADFCADVKPEKAEYCLLKNENRLSPTCAKDFATKKRTLLVKNECAMDIVNTCYKEVPGNDGSINKCLIQNKTKLSKFCQTNVTNMVAKMKKENPCFDDQEKFCAGKTHFVDIHECLEKKLSTLAPGCKTVVMAEQEKIKANPCYKDLKRHCLPGLSPNAQVRCLTVNDQNLTSACRQHRAVMEDKVKKMVSACENDRVRLCPKAPLKDGLVLKCLKEKKAQVSAGCKSFI